MSQIHLFSEVDLDLYQEANKVYDKLFDICEQIGFMPCKEKYGFSVTGGFNIPDEFDGEMQFQIKKSVVRDAYFIHNVRFVIRDNESREIEKIYYLFKDCLPTNEAEGLFL